MTTHVLVLLACLCCALSASSSNGVEVVGKSIHYQTPTADRARFGDDPSEDVTLLAQAYSAGAHQLASAFGNTIVTVLRLLDPSLSVQVTMNASNPSVTVDDGNCVLPVSQLDDLVEFVETVTGTLGSQLISAVVSGAHRDRRCELAWHPVYLLYRSGDKRRTNRD